MTRQMQRDQERLQDLILKMAGCVESAIFRAIKAVRERDQTTARSVIKSDTEIDLLENQVQEECLTILALHQPVAVDLRRITTVLLISTDLERMGDLAAEIAERSLTLSIPPFFEVPERLPHMANETTTMVRHALDAFVNADVDSARRVIAADDAVDEDNVQLITAITETMKHQPTLIDAGISMFSVVRHLERIADHATNIAEDVIYLVEGAMVRHAQPGGSVPPPETA